MTRLIPAAVVGADVGIPVGLLVNELITNAIKYAYPEGSGPVEVSGRTFSDCYVIKISDEGPGFPADFDQVLKGRSGLGLRLIKSLSQQIKADVKFSEADVPGTVTISLPLE